MRRSILGLAFALVLLPITVADLQAAQIDPRIEAARQEGELDWIDSVMIPASAVKFAEAFKRHYGLTDLKVKHQYMLIGVLGQRITEELRSGKVSMDVFAGSSPRLFYALLQAGELTRYESPNAKSYLQNNKNAGVTFEPGYWISPFAYVMSPLANPKFFSKEIRSWNDLLDPQLKGQKIDYVNADTAESGLYHYYGVRQVMPLSYFEKLAEQKPIFSIGSVDRTQKVAMGETFVAVTSVFRQYQTEFKTGEKSRIFFPKEGSPLFGHPYGIMAKARHPNAAKLFVDFIMSEEGNNLFVELEGVMSAREGYKVPSKIRPYSPPLAEVKAIPLDWKGIDDAALDAARAEFKKVFKR